VLGENGEDRGLEEKWPYTVVAGPDDREEVEHAPELLLVHGGWVLARRLRLSGNTLLAGDVDANTAPASGPELARERDDSVGVKTRNRRFFLFFIFHFHFLQKYIFVFEIYRNIPRPPRCRAAGTWSPRCGVAGAFL